FISFSFGLVGMVIDVVDGRNIVILTEKNERIKVKLYAIKVPNGDELGEISRQFLKQRLSSASIKIKEKSKIKFGEVAGVVYYGDMDINALSVANGYSLSDTSVSNEYLNLENSAKKYKFGIWSKQHK
ncbi:MAG: thermonuclease family protein, partial [Campylobacteraceae bacterium]